MNKLILEWLYKILQTMPCEVLEVSENSLLKVQPLVFNKVKLPIINNVPIGHIGSDRAYLHIKVVKGEKGLLFFSSMDMTGYRETGTLSECETDEYFNLNSCVFVPIKGLSKDKAVITPTNFDFEIKGKIKITGDMEIIGKVIQTGNYEIAGDVTNTGNLTTTGKITTADLTATGTVILPSGTKIGAKSVDDAHKHLDAEARPTGGVI